MYLPKLWKTWSSKPRNCYRNGERCDENAENRLCSGYFRYCRSWRWDSGKPVGTVWIAAAYKNEIVSMKQEGDEGRKGNVEKAIQNALLLLCEKLK